MNSTSRTEVLETVKGKNDELDKKENRKIFPAAERQADKKRQIDCRYGGGRRKLKKRVSVYEEENLGKESTLISRLLCPLHEIKEHREALTEIVSAPLPFSRQSGGICRDVHFPYSF